MNRAPAVLLASLLLSCAATRPSATPEVPRPRLPCVAPQAPVEEARLHTDAPIERMVATDLGVFLLTARGLYLLPRGAHQARRWAAEHPIAMVSAGGDTFWLDGERLHSIQQGIDRVVPARCPDGLLEALGNPETAPTCFGASMQLEGDSVYFKNPIGQIFSLPKAGGTARPIELRRFDCLIERNEVGVVSFVSRGRSILESAATWGCAGDASWIDLDGDRLLMLTAQRMDGDHLVSRPIDHVTPPAVELVHAPGFILPIAVVDHRVLFAHHLGERDRFSLFAVSTGGGPLTPIACDVEANEQFAAESGRVYWLEWTGQGGLDVRLMSAAVPARL